MGFFKLGGMSIKGVFQKPVTKMYPVVVPEYFERTAGHVEQNDIDSCIFCGLCEKRCPTNAIKVDKAAGTWSIDPWNCITCNSCVRVCPKNILSMERTYTTPATEKSWVTLTMSDEAKAERARQEAEKKAKREAAAKAAAEKKAAEAAAKKEEAAE
ncbi:MAG: 4Fe-4S dicluster domain-containing protein [Actinomycetota bacterium]|nr:4Fe-4S dicluster domain-containing protein [Actinomycetota bacterium]